MIDKEKIFDFYIFDKILRKSMSTINASEAHGILISFLCINYNKRFDIKNMMLRLLDIQQNKKIIGNFIEQLYNHNLIQIKEIDKILVLMIPNKDEKLSYKITCLTMWLKGFISGLGIIGVNKKEYDIPLLYDIVNDFSVITYANNTAKENEESHYINLMEYIKISVELIYFEVYKNKNI